MDIKLIKLLEIFIKDEYITATKLAQHIEVSEKTVRGRIKLLQDEIKNHGAEIIAKQRLGYKLIINDNELFQLWKYEQNSRVKESIPNSSNEREKYLLSMFLNDKGYFKQEEISDKLYVSTKTISSEIKRVEYILNQYNIKIERRPSYGMRAVGSEFDFRRCIMDYLLKPEISNLHKEKNRNEIYEKIAKMILEVIKVNSLSLSEMAFQNLVLYLYMIYKRTSVGYNVKADNDKINIIRNRKEFYIADLVLKYMINMGLNIEYSVDEVFYIAIYIAGKRMIDVDYNTESNILIPKKIDNLVFKMLENIYEIYRVDLREDLNLRMLLNQHMIPFDIRMQYGISIENLLIEDIKQKYSLSYTMTEVGIKPISEYYGKEISDEEIGYFAILIQMALENRGNEIEKKNILLVCVTGKASSQFLMFKFKKEFKNYINEIKICNLYELANYDLKDIDYIFSTVPIQTKVDIPIYLINNFLEENEIMSVRKKLELGNLNDSYFKEELFFKDVEGENKEDVLYEICKKIERIRPLNKEFYNSVLGRERLGSTDYGNLSAIPHPQQILLEDNLVCVSILKKPIIWEKNEVQLVILTSVSNSTSKSTQRFYEMTTGILSDIDKVKEIIKYKSFDKFIEILNK